MAPDGCGQDSERPATREGAYLPVVRTVNLTRERWTSVTAARTTVK
jgi:hypothetical protein